MARRYLVHPLPEPGIRNLPDDVAHHVGTVLRLRTGATIILHDGRGQEAQAVLLDPEPRARGPSRTARVGSPRASTAPEPRLALTAVFAPPRTNRAEWIFEHGCEIGITHFAPIETTRTRPIARADKRVDRWRRIVAAASGQCDRGRVPSVSAPRPLESLLEEVTVDAKSPAFLASPCAEDPFAPLPLATERATVFIGPEGGFSKAEHDAITDCGVRPARLGPLILRAETAVLAAAAILLQQPTVTSQPADGSGEPDPRPG